MPTYIQLASDTFQRANETPLLGHGNWDITVNGGTGNNAQCVLFSNACRCRRTTFNTGTFWTTSGGPNSVVFPPDQFAETTVSILPITNGYFIGALCRGANDGNAHLNGYSFHVIRTSATASEYRIVKWVSSGLTTLASITGMPAIVLNDVVRLEVQGTTLTGFYNGVQKLQVTDSTYTSGQPGIVMFGAVDATPGSKNWDAGSIINVLNLNVTLFQNYFSPSVLSDPISVSTTPVVFGTITNFVPIILGVTVAGFGVSSSNPIEIDGYSAATQLFSSPGQGPFPFGTADNWGRSDSGLLKAPGGGSVGNHTYYVVAGGDISTDVNTRTPWSLVCRLRQGGGRGSYWTRADSIVGGNPVLTSFPNRNPASPAQLQLSLGINFSNTPTAPVVRLMQFEIQELP